MDRVLEIWDILKEEEGPQIGYISRRFSTSVESNVFVALKKPENWYTIFWLFEYLPPINLQNFRSMAEIHVSHNLQVDGSNKQMLAFSLKNDAHKDIFATLAGDLIQSVGMEREERLVFNKLVNQFEKWRTLFSKMFLGGLSQEQQIGLYGELFFLRELLHKFGNSGWCVRAWKGPEKNEIDFQMGEWGVEVKTSKVKLHQKIQISSEKQLDSENLRNLYLYFLAVDKYENTGETLNSLIKDIESLLSLDEENLTSFRSKLYEAGYFQSESELYDQIGYKVRETSVFRVSDEFPKITARDLMYGIGDVKYSILIDSLGSFSIVFDQMMHKIEDEIKR